MTLIKLRSKSLFDDVFLKELRRRFQREHFDTLRSKPLKLSTFLKVMSEDCQNFIKMEIQVMEQVFKESTLSKFDSLSAILKRKFSGMFLKIQISLKFLQSNLLEKLEFQKMNNLVQQIKFHQKSKITFQIQLKILENLVE